MVTENVFDYAQLNPVQTQPVDTPPNTEATTGTSTTTVPVMSEQEAINKVSPTITMPQLAASMTGEKAIKPNSVDASANVPPLRSRDCHSTITSGEFKRGQKSREGRRPFLRRGTCYGSSLKTKRS